MALYIPPQMPEMFEERDVDKAKEQLSGNTKRWYGIMM